MGLKVDETKVARGGASLNTNILNGTKFAKDGLELLLVPLGRDVLDEAVGPGISGLVALVGVVLLNQSSIASSDLPSTNISTEYDNLTFAFIIISSIL